MSDCYNRNDIFMQPKTDQYGSHMIMTNVHKPNKTKYINVDTRFREDYASRDPYPLSKCSTGVCGETSTPNPSFNYTTEVNHNIYIPERVNEVKSMKVNSVEIPCTFYNVSSAIGNNSFKIINNTVAFDTSNNEIVNVATQDDVSLQNSVNPSVTFMGAADASGNTNLTYYVDTIVVPDGQYDATQLKDAINTQIALLDRIDQTGDPITTADTDDLVFDISTNTLGTKTFVYSKGSTLTIDFSADDTGVSNIQGFTSSLGWMLGFRTASTTVEYDLLYETGYAGNAGSSGYGPSGQPLVNAMSVVNMNVPRYLYLAVDEYNNKGNQRSFITPLTNSLINKNIIGRISVDKANNGFGNYEFGKLLIASIENGMLCSDTRTYTGKSDLLKMNVKLLYENGNIVSLNGVDFSFLLEVEHE